MNRLSSSLWDEEWTKTDNLWVKKEKAAWRNMNEYLDGREISKMNMQNNLRA